MLSLLFIGIRLEQQFGFGKLLICTCWFTMSLPLYLYFPVLSPWSWLDYWILDYLLFCNINLLYFPVLAPWLDTWLSIIFQHQSPIFPSSSTLIGYLTIYYFPTSISTWKMYFTIYIISIEMIWADSVLELMESWSKSEFSSHGGFFSGLAFVLQLLCFLYAPFC